MAQLLVLATLFALATFEPARAQTVSATTGALTGTVTDNTKGVLPGVTVTITSASLMGTRTATTDADGQYRFAAVPPGGYRLTFEMPGFTTLIREPISVGLGFTATVHVEMGLATQQESVTVVGESPVVDTQATKVATNYSAEQMANLPNARDYAALMAATPSVKVARIDVGGSAALNVNTYRTYGMQGQDRPMVEGMLASEGTSLLFYTDYGSFSEVSVGTAGNSAEMSGPGVFTQFIAKSGGNQYRGNLYFDYNNRNFGSRNIDDALLARGVTGGGSIDARDTNRVDSYRDFNADIGGYVVKDRLWWYYSYRDTRVETGRPQYAFGVLDTKVRNHTAKATFNLTQNDKIIAFLNYNKKRVPDDPAAVVINRQDAVHISNRSTWNQQFPAGVWKAEYNRVVGSAAFFEVRGGNYFYNWNRKAKAPDLPRFEDLSTLLVTGGAPETYTKRGRPQVHTSLSYFKNGWGGTHNFKVGGEVMNESYEDFWEGTTGNIVHVMSNGAPLEVRLYEQPNTSESGLRSIGAYVTDTWQLNRRVTLNVGVRLDRFVNFLPEQIHRNPFTSETATFGEVSQLSAFNNIGPRIGVSFDVAGDGKTVVKANWGRYLNSPGPSPFNPNPGQWYRRYQWTDANGSGLYESGEEGRLIATQGGVTNEAIDPNWKMGPTNELATFLEREVVPNFGVRTGFVWRHASLPSVRVDANRPFDAFDTPVTVPDPGPDGVAGNADDGAPIAGYNLSAGALASTPFNLRTHLADAASDFYTWEITATKRMSDRWSLVASFANTWSHENANALNPNQNINADDASGRRHTSSWQSKVYTTFQLPLDVRLTPLLRMEAGAPYGRRVVARFNYGNETVYAEPLGANRLDTFALVDVRLEKGFRFGGRRLAAFFDLFNVTNANPVTGIVDTAGTSFLRPLAIVSPRIARIGAKLEW